MLNTDEINKIRNYSNMGFSFTEVCMLTGRDPKTVRKYLLMEDFSPKKPTPIEEKEKLIKPSKLDPYKETIDRYLAEDEKMWFKQHHTSRQIWKRLMFEEGYTGGYSLVQRYVREKREEKKAKRTNLELIREPGDAEIDFGEAYFVDADTKEKLRKSFMVLKFPYSGKGFVQVFSGEAVECVCKGLMDIFEFICGVPRRIILDSSTGAGGIDNGNIYESEMFQRFQAHYHFKAVYHSVWHPQSKGSAERYIQTIRKTMFVPPQTISDIEAYNKSLLYKNKPDANIR